jgi:hypothetical protein
VRMKYRDKLLEKLLPKRLEMFSKHEEQVDVSGDIRVLLARYENVIERAANRNLQKDDSREPVATAHTHAAAN